MAHRYQIRLDTEQEAIRFSNIAHAVGGKIIIEDDEGMRVNASSVLGMLYAMTFRELWCYSDEDIYQYISDFVII